MKQFYISDFPKFDAYCSKCDWSIKIVQIFIDDGFSSIKMAPPGEGWFLSEEDYTWFVLKWS